MGSSRWDDDDWSSHSTRVSSQSQAQIFTTTASNAATVANDLLPVNYKGPRESCDSTVNPNSTPIIIGVDETGSMGKLAVEIIKNGLGVLVSEIYKRKPVTDPHVMLMGLGDAYSDKFPVQATQFEAGVKESVDQISRIFIESNGGGNGGESYNLAWYLAARKTKIDSFLKRNKKGYLFTIGDEDLHPVLTKEAIKEFFGDNLEDNLTSEQLFTMVSAQWEVFHLYLNESGHTYSGSTDGIRDWKTLLGERALELTDHSKLAEVVVSTIEVCEGKDAATVTKSWSGDTSLVVAKAINGLTKTAVGAGSGVNRF